GTSRTWRSRHKGAGQATSQRTPPRVKSEPMPYFSSFQCNERMWGQQALRCGCGNGYTLQSPLPRKQCRGGGDRHENFKSFPFQQGHLSMSATPLLTTDLPGTP